MAKNRSKVVLDFSTLFAMIGPFKYRYEHTLYGGLHVVRKCSWKN